MNLSGGPTKDEVLAIAILKLELGKEDCVLDIGCGTGKVSIAAARIARQVYAIDRRPDAIACASENAARSGITNVSFLQGEALEILNGMEPVDAAFVGGSGDLSGVLRLLAGKVRRRIVVNAVRLGTLWMAVKTMRELGIFREALHVQVSRSHELAGDLHFRPIDPVFVIVGGREC